MMWEIMCGFVYYTSLEYLWRKGEDGKVVPMHVLPLGEEGDVERGVAVTVGLVWALAASLER